MKDKLLILSYLIPLIGMFILLFNSRPLMEMAEDSFLLMIHHVSFCFIHAMAITYPILHVFFLN